MNNMKSEDQVCLRTRDWKRISKSLHRSLDKIHSHPDEIVSKGDFKELDRFLYLLDQTFFQGKLIELED